MDHDDQVAEIEEWVRKRERTIRRQHRLAKVRRRVAPIARALVAVLPAGAGVLVVRQLMDRSDPSAANAAAAPNIPGPSTPAHAVPAGPFAGTPAASYPKGAAGITLPPARAVRGFSAKQVAADLARVRTALIASRLDPRMIIRHDTSRFVTLPAPASQSFAREQFATASAGGSATCRRSSRAPRC